MLDKDSLGALLESALDDIEAHTSAETPKPVGRLTGVQTGFTDLDLLTGGLQRGELTVVASRPGLGRTTLISDVLRFASIRSAVPTAVFSLEEDHTKFSTRVISAECKVARHHIHSAAMLDEDWTRLARGVPTIVEAPMIVKTPASLTMSELAEQARLLVAERKIQLLAVDGIQDIKPEKRSDLREREVGDVARGLKTLARELDIPILATSHLNRSPEQRWDKRPMLDDLRESGAITFSADVIVLLHRDDAYDRESPRAGEADLIVAKHRHGPTATIVLAFQGHYGRFMNLAIA